MVNYSMYYINLAFINKTYVNLFLKLTLDKNKTMFKERSVLSCGISEFFGGHYMNVLAHFRDSCREWLFFCS